MPDQIIGFTLFTGDALRPVCRDREGRQYIKDDAGERHYGFWLRRGPTARTFSTTWTTGALPMRAPLTTRLLSCMVPIGLPP